MSYVALERAETGAAGVAAAERPPGRRRRPSAWHLLLIPVALVMLFPFVWLVITSVSTLAETRSFPPSQPAGFPLQWIENAVKNYGDAWTLAPFGRWVLNTAVVTAVVVAGNLVFCSLAGYALARLRFFARTALFLVILATLMVPFQVVMIPVLLICRDLGLVDTLGALIAPNLVTPFGIFLLRQFFKTLPLEIEEAARIDGATRLGTLVKVLLPSMAAPLATVGIMTMLWSWNDFLWPLIAIQSEKSMTLQLGLSTFVGAHATNWPVLMAGTVMTQVPMLLIFLVAQRWFVQSFASSGVKG
jgi:multiple sugar transport system permease protein